MKKIRITDKTYGRLNLGRLGENDVTEVIFNFSSWVEEFGEGDVALMVERNGDEGPYLVPLSIEEHLATWTVSASDLANEGFGRAEYKYTVGEKVVKSQIFETFVLEALDNSSEPPTPWKSYIDLVEEYKDSAEASAESSSASANRSEDARDEIEGMTIGATIDNNSGVPTITVTKSIESGVVHLQMDFKNLKGADGAVAFAIVDELPTTDIHTNWIYLLKTSEDEGNKYTEYVYINGEWEVVGTATIDLSNYIQKLTTYTPGDVVTMSVDGGITDGGIALSELATLSALSQALATKVDISAYTADKAEIEAEIEAKADKTELASKVGMNETYTDTQKDSICATIGAVRDTSFEEWTFTLDDNTTVTKKVVVV